MIITGGVVWGGGVVLGALFPPSAPTITTATVVGSTATIIFTKPSCSGSTPISSYYAYSTPPGFNATVSASVVSTVTNTGSISINNLCANGAFYRFTLYASNSLGDGNSVTTGILPSTYKSGECASYTTPGSYSWVAPAGITSVSVVAVGGGGGGRGAPTANYGGLGGASIFSTSAVLQAGGGGANGGTGGTSAGGAGYVAYAGGIGGTGGGSCNGGGGGGAGG